jgi:hypothetical protein
MSEKRDKLGEEVPIEGQTQCPRFYALMSLKARVSVVYKKIF